MNNLHATKNENNKTTSPGHSANNPLPDAGADIPLQHELRCQRQPDKPVQAKSITNPVTGTDSAVIAVADSALLNAINVDKAETEQSIINVYPNPASDKVGISYTASCPKCVLRIFTIEAKQVYEAKGINKETEIDISNLKSGVLPFNDDRRRKTSGVEDSKELAKKE